MLQSCFYISINILHILYSDVHCTSEETDSETLSNLCKVTEMAELGAEPLSLGSKAWNLYITPFTFLNNEDGRFRFKLQFDL